MTKTKLPPCEHCKLNKDCKPFKEGVRYGCENFHGDIRIFLLDNAESRLFKVAKNETLYIVSAMVLLFFYIYFFLNDKTGAAMACAFGLILMELNKMRKTISSMLSK